MKVLTLMFVAYLACDVNGRKVLKPLDKSANVDFINMEGGGVKPAPGPVKPSAQNHPSPTLNKATVGVVNPPTFQSADPLKPVQPAPVTARVVTIPPKQNVAPPSKPGNAPTPGPGSVQHLINYYDSQGKASPIRPYSYSQAVKQG